MSWRTLSGVVEPWLVAVALFGAEQLGDGLVADLASPLDVGAVEDFAVAASVDLTGVRRSCCPVGLNVSGSPTFFGRCPPR